MRFFQGIRRSRYRTPGPIFGTPVAELMPDSQRYFDYHHSAGDVFENVNKRELELGAINMAAFDLSC